MAIVLLLLKAQYFLRSNHYLLIYPPLDYPFSLPVTLGTVGVLDGRQCVPCDPLGRPYHPLERPPVVGGAVAIPGGDAAWQDALNCASLKVCEGLRGQDKFLQPPEVEEALLCLLHHAVCVCVDHFRLSVMCTPRNLKLFTFSTAVLWMRACSLCFSWSSRSTPLFCWRWGRGYFLGTTPTRPSPPPCRLSPYCG